VELLVVIVIILILAGLLLPALAQARARAKMTKCITQLSQFGTAIVSYRDDHDKAMPPWLSTLNPDYVPSTRLYVCPQDGSAGNDGSRPGAGWPDNTYGGGPITINGQTSPDGNPDQNDIVDNVMKDEFFNTDDTSRNNAARLATGANPIIEKCSYGYEFPAVECTWDPVSPHRTWNVVKDEQLKNGYGKDPANWTAASTAWDPTLFPVVRCFYHYGVVWGKKEVVLNASYDGNYFLTKLEWEQGIYR